MGGRTIFGPNKALRVAGRLMARLGASTILDKRARPNTHCSPDKKRGLSPKLEKRSRGAWETGGRGSLSVAASSKRKRGASRLGASKKC